MSPEPASMAAARVDRTLFALWALFWLLMLAIAIEDHRGETGLEWWEPFVWEGSSCLVGTAWLLLQRRMAPSWDRDLANPWRWFRRSLAWLPVIAVSFIVAAYGIRHGVYSLAGEVYEHRDWPTLFWYEGIKILLYAGLWLGLIFGLESFASWRLERERLLTLQKHLAESQLAQLKAQFQPHFLFNALNTISSLMQVDVPRADRLLTLLADLLRASLQAGGRDMNPLRDELELLRLYAHIMQERFLERVSIHWNIADDVLDASVPALLLQPLLENAFKHSVEPSATPVRIEVAARRDGDTLEVTVRNTAIQDRRVDAATSGIGLRNCRERLAVIYGSAAELTLERHEGDVQARLTLPWAGLP